MLTGAGGELGGMIFSRPFPPGEPTKPFAKHRRGGLDDVLNEVIPK